MPEPIKSSAPLAAPQAPTPRVAPTPAGPAAAVATDQLALGRRPPAIEADVRFAMHGRPLLQAQGTVRVQRTFLERYIRSVLSDERVFPTMKVGFDPATKRFTGEGQVRWLGIPWPVAIAARPRVVGDKLGVQFEEIQLRLGSWRIGVPFMKGMAAGIVVDELHKSLIRADKGPRPGLVLMEPTSLIHELGIAPPFVRLDMERTKMALDVADGGEVTLRLDADAAPPAPANTPRSDIAVSVDEAALTAFMREAIGREYDLKAITLREGGAAVRGQADFKPVSDTLNAAKAILLLAALAGNGGRGAAGMDGNMVAVKGDLDLDVKVEGRTMTVKPSIGLAAKEMKKVLDKAGIPAEVKGGTVVVDMDGAARTFGATLSRLRLDEHGVTLEGGLDVERLIRKQGLLAEG